MATKKVISSTERWTGNHLSDSVYEYLFLTDLLSKASALNFPILPHTRLYSLSPGKNFFDWGDIHFSIDAAIYSDWEYFQRISGGVNSLGVGVTFASLSAGWSESLWSSFKRKVRENQTKPEEISLSKEAVVTGFVSFFEQNDSVLQTENAADNFDMEGTRWVAAAICNRRVATVEERARVEWSLVYYRTDGFMFPIGLWERMEQSVTTFAEVVPVSVYTKAGQKNCFLKARATAYLKSEEVNEFSTGFLNSLKSGIKSFFLGSDETYE